jgi:uncharacterized protein with HEPN domain
MQRDRRVYIVDAVQAGERVMRFVAGVALAEYESDEMIHSAVERQFEIIGEALRQLGRVDPDVVTTTRHIEASSHSEISWRTGISPYSMRSCGPSRSATSRRSSITCALFSRDSD